MKIQNSVWRKLFRINSLLNFSALLLTAGYASESVIVGGRSVPIEDYPWQVSTGGCGGTIISETWIVTAGHCVSPTRSYTIQAGKTKRTDSETVRRSSKRVIRHSQYRSVNSGYDIALIELAEPLVFNSKIQPVGYMTKPLSQSGMDAPGVKAEVSGWGALSQNGSSATTLQAATVPIVSTAVANERIAYNGAISSTMIAAGYKEGGIDACQGDSGGPLVVKDGRGWWVLAGIVSWGSGCARENKYGIYARVSVFDDWIRQQTGVVGGILTKGNVLSINKLGRGTVTSASGDINCGTDCIEIIEPNTSRTIKLTAVADPGWVFTGWSGICTGSATCTVNVNSSIRVTAEFETPSFFKMALTNGEATNEIKTLSKTNFIGLNSLSSSSNIKAEPTSQVTRIDWKMTGPNGESQERTNDTQSPYTLYATNSANWTPKIGDYNVEVTAIDNNNPNVVIGRSTVLVTFQTIVSVDRGKILSFSAGIQHHSNTLNMKLDRSTFLDIDLISLDGTKSALAKGMFNPGNHSFDLSQETRGLKILHIKGEKPSQQKILLK